ncbi:hypothetical protein BURPS1710b_A0645 [Burkholderia pseudomallei 1710b]|uniref:Uncharacterized protein n=1 Tax=Burkholderia pseudomallei (strain 1710b) TaxID=320372 RepID=Q3JKV0_BURP1|nr:hypothetical protein BURPS1710b_A0645 [Burkholderia pseudomallei 1710b]
MHYTYTLTPNELIVEAGGRPYSEKVDDTETPAPDVLLDQDRSRVRRGTPDCRAEKGMGAPARRRAVSVGHRPAARQQRADRRAPHGLADRAVLARVEQGETAGKKNGRRAAVECVDRRERPGASTAAAYVHHEPRDAAVGPPARALLRARVRIADGAQHRHAPARVPRSPAQREHGQGARRRAKRGGRRLRRPRRGAKRQELPARAIGRARSAVLRAAHATEPAEGARSRGHHEGDARRRFRYVRRAGHAPAQPAGRRADARLHAGPVRSVAGRIRRAVRQRRARACESCVVTRRAPKRGPTHGAPRVCIAIARRASVATRSRRLDRDEAKISMRRRARRPVRWPTAVHADAHRATRALAVGLSCPAHVRPQRRNVHAVHPAFPGSRSRTTFFRGDAQRRARLSRRSRRRRSNRAERRIRGGGVAARSRARRARPRSGVVRFGGPDARAQAQLKRPRLRPSPRTARRHADPRLDDAAAKPRCVEPRRSLRSLRAQAPQRRASPHAKAGACPLQSR